LAVREAMAAGIPIVSSAIGGTDELIEDGRSGLLVPPGDAEALAAALRRALGEPALREEMATRARERVGSGLRREQMASRVTDVYRELLGEEMAAAAGTDLAVAEALPESRRNAILRRSDWRFALPDAEILVRWRLPRPGRARRVRRHFEAAGYSEVRVYWAGPLPHRLPQFWLPVESPEAVEHLLATRRPGSVGGAALRRLWRLARKAGLLAPLYVVGRRSDGAQDGDAKQVGDLPLPPSAPLLLLTGGHRSINKAVGLAFEPGLEKPTAAAKFARVAEAEPGLEREASVLDRLGKERPDLRAVPNLRGEGRRAGRLAVVQDAVEGRSLLDVLTPDNFEALAMRVTRVLIALADRRITEPAITPPIGGKVPARDADGRRRLVGEALADFERHFGPVVAQSLIADARALLGRLGDLPLAPEHRDCSPWNVLITPTGDPTLLDWESSEPDGLPGMDLVYFLANCAFVLDGAIESGRTRESYARLLDPATPYGRIAARAIADYSAALEISADDFRRLRLLCWLVHSRSDYRHLQLESSGPPRPEDLRRGMFLGLVEEELR
ncbi:MAG: glycosyltransferase, partial [Solirubrobacterales bacterium]